MGWELVGGERANGEDKGVGEYDQSTLCSCVKIE
jgi:hypothetical protein